MSKSVVEADISSIVWLLPLSPLSPTTVPHNHHRLLTVFLSKSGGDYEVTGFRNLNAGLTRWKTYCQICPFVTWISLTFLAGVELVSQLEKHFEINVFTVYEKLSLRWSPSQSVNMPSVLPLTILLLYLHSMKNTHLILREKTCLQ